MIRPWWQEFLSDRADILKNEDVATLVQFSVINKEGHLSSDGALVIRTGDLVNRAAKDQYVVADAYTEAVLDWKGIRKISQRQYDNVKNEIIQYYNSHIKPIYVMELSSGAEPFYSLGIRFISTQASQALFVKHMFRKEVSRPELGSFTILHCPHIDLNVKGLGIRSRSFVGIDFTNKEIIIAGTNYAGEIKKAVFAVLSVLLPEKNVLPIHASANMDAQGNVSVFFGLSGTGKTSLSTDDQTTLIGDDEHAVCEEGIFNLENGCYAKTNHLTFSEEPQIYRACNRFGAILENVYIDNDHVAHFDNESITKNGRATYPLSYIKDSTARREVKFPDNFFFLTSDAMGVLPVVARLSNDKAIHYFESGYNSRVTRSEMADEIKVTFSACYGSSSMLRKKTDYTELLKFFLEKFHVNIWLINTGWYGGDFETGKRFDIRITRKIIREIQKGLPESTKFWIDPAFGLSIPASIPGVDPAFLNPRTLWLSMKDYDESAIRLNDLFVSKNSDGGTEFISLEE